MLPEEGAKQIKNLKIIINKTKHERSKYTCTTNLSFFSFPSSCFFSFCVLPFSTVQFHFTHYFRNKGQQIIKFISTMPCPKSCIPKIRCFDVVERKSKNRKRRIDKLIHICLSLFSKVCFSKKTFKEKMKFKK